MSAFCLVVRHAVCLTLDSNQSLVDPAIATARPPIYRWLELDSQERDDRPRRHYC